MTKKVLLADDEDRMRKLLSDFLKREGYAILEAANGKEALDIFQQTDDLSLLILDVMMPLMDGWEVCREVRKTSRVPIIMLTARDQEADELMGFELGADEYISKPFSPPILIARVNALLRRTEGKNYPPRTIGGLVIDENAHYVYVNGEVIDLTPKEFELLVYLADHEGRALNRDQIVNAVWSYDFYGDMRTVDVHIKNLRLKLGEMGDCIQTVRGIGYRFEGRK